MPQLLPASQPDRHVVGGEGGGGDGGTEFQRLLVVNKAASQLFGVLPAARVSASKVPSFKVMDVLERAAALLSLIHI